MEYKPESCVSAVYLISFITFNVIIFIASFIKPCNLNDSQLPKCLLTAMESLRPRLPGGIPEMHIPKMEPLRVEKAVLESGNDLKLIFKNMDIYNLTTFKVVNGEFDIKNDFVKIDVNFDELSAEGEYSIKGKLLFLNLNGNGRVNGTLRKFYSSSLFLPN